jgi:hypothetical protein
MAKELNANETVAVDALAGTILRHKIVNDLIKELTAEKDTLAGTIREAIGDKVGGTVNGAVVVTVPFRENTNVRGTVVKELAPEVYDAALTRTPYRPVLHTG